ncbi:NnrU family protein [Defluviimonas sp. WL0024]|uniref:NnrU family protein n=1 Tax=Albidovulum salinarum TaxID=2984153 RepID=A0ABT2XBN6_9RHOB|nr:NnrU family protein [Defluviimonas sp. WL0024]MCU9849115.1 NnrU family protein [Defluviimonas sp. WL0024]
MQVMILGLVLWTVAHLFKRVAPGLRARLGVLPGKMLVSVLSIAALALIVIGYRRAGVDPVYTPWPGMGHLNNLLMLIAVFLIGVPHSKGIVKTKLRHPMLLSVALWAVAHLLVNGDMASAVLFGWLGLWALVSMALISSQEPWTPPATGKLRSDLIGAAITLVVYALIAGAHYWLGYSPFLGTYG